MPRFAANLSFLYPEWPFLERFAAAAADGFAGVEYLFPYAYPVEVLAQTLRRHGLQQVLFNAPAGGLERAQAAAAWDAGARGTLCRPGDQAAFRAGLLLALADAQALACPRVHVMAGLLPQGHTRAALFDLVAERLRWACARAAEVGVTLLIEPINLRDMPGYYLNHQDQARALIDAVGAPNLRLQMDFYHCQVQEGDVSRKLAQHIACLGHVQLAGVPARQEPDQGELRCEYLLAQLDALGYTGWVGCEYRPARGATPQGTTLGLGWLRAAIIAQPSCTEDKG